MSDARAAGDGGGLPKPYYQDDAVTIYHGDCREIVPTLGKVDLLLSDPPYGINWNCDYRSWTKPSAKAQGGRSNRTYPQIHGDDKPFDPSEWFGFPKVILWGAPCFMGMLPNGTLLVWHKRNSAFLAQAEAAWMKGGSGCYVYSEPVEKMQNERKHPTQKPLGLMMWCINKAGNAQTILDPFMGSGTTLRAAKDLGRKAIGIELEERYCEISAKRMQQEVLPLYTENAVDRMAQTGVDCQHEIEMEGLS